MLKTQLVDLKFISGVDTKTDSPNTLYTSFREMKNSRMDQVGAVIPRGGFSIRPFSSTTTPAFDIVSNDEAVIVAESGALRQVGSTSIAANNPIASAVRGTLERLYGGDAIPGTLTMTALGNTVYMAWIVPDSAGNPSSSIGLFVYDSVTGRTILRSTTNVNISLLNVRLTTWNNKVVAVLLRSNFTFALYQFTPDNFSFPLTNSSWTGAPSGTTDLKYSIVGNSTTLYVAYVLDNSSSVNVATLVGSPGSSTNAIVTGVLSFTNKARCPSIALSNIATTTIVVAAGCNGVEAKGVLCNAAGSPIGATPSAAVSATFVFNRMAVNTTTTNNANIGFSGKESSSGNYTHGFMVVTLVGGSGSSGDPYPAQFLTGPAIIDNLPLAVAETMSSASYGSQSLVAATGAPSSRVGSFGASANLGTYMDTELLQLPNPVQIGSKTFYPVPMITAINAIAAVPTGSTTFKETILTPKTQATIVIHDTSEHPPSILDTTNRQNLYLGASQNQITAFDRGAGVWPELSINTALDLSPGTGNIRPAGVVSYVFAKLWKSADGIEYRTYSPIYTAQMAANTSMALRLTPMNFLGGIRISAEVKVEAYRTEVNGTLFYLYDTYIQGGAYQDISQDGATGILANRLADINSGELPPELPQSARLVTPFKDRIALVGPDKPNSVLFNRPAPFPLGTSFASGLEVDVGQAGGNLTAMVQMDSALYLFKSNSIYTMYGDAPGATGENGTLTVPQIVFNGTGCSDPRSALLTPKGIVMKSGKGFYLIARNQQLEFIGQGPYTDNTFKVIGAAIAETQYEVMFTFSNGSIWVLNMDTMAWYEWTCPLTPRAITATGGNVTIAVDTGAMVYSTANLVDQVTAGTTAEIAQDVTTGWFRFQNIRGFQRVKRLYLQGQVLANCNITIDIYMDYKDTPVMTKVLAATTTDNLEIDLHLEVQKGESMSFRIRTDKYGIKLSGATLEIGAKTGTDKARSSGSNLS